MKNKNLEHYQILEDKLWATKAQQAEKTGFLTAEDSEAFLNSKKLLQR